MHRTQILIEEWQYERLRSRAEREGRSLSDLVREILGDALEPGVARAAGKLGQIEGIGEDSANYGEEHDRLLYHPADGD